MRCRADFYSIIEVLCLIEKEVNVMSWLKKTFNKLFKENEYEQYEEPFEYDEEEVTEEVSTKKTAFRFPLIDDAEIAPPPPIEKKQSRVQQESLPYEERPLTLPKHLQHTVSQVFDVETQGIRQLLAERQKRTGYSHVLSRSTQERRALSVIREERKKAAAKPAREEKKVNREFINPLESKKRFVPTEVPSPVYGFQKTKPLEDLLAEKHTEQEVAEPAETIVEDREVIQVIQQEKVFEIPREPGLQQAETNTEVVKEELVIEERSLENPIINEIPIVRESTIEREPEIELEKGAEKEPEPEIEQGPEVKPETDSEIGPKPEVEIEIEQGPEVEREPDSEIEAEDSSEQVQLEASPHMTVSKDAADTLSDLQVQHLTIENSTVHIGQLNVEQAPPQDERPIIEEPAKPSGSRLPFNVLMLKSDKEKLKAQAILEEQLRKKKPEITDEPSKNETPVETIVSGSPIMPSVTLHSSAAQQAAVAVLEREEQTEQKEIAEETAPVDVEASQQADEVTQQQEEETFFPETKEIAATEICAAALATDSSSTVNETVQVEEVEPEEPKFSRQYEKPSMGFLVPPEEQTEDWVWMDEQGERLIKALSYFHIEAEIVSIVQGPAVTQFEITVAHGTKVSKVRGLADDIKLALAARDIRIDAPIPGKHSIGIEIPNRVSRAVRLSEVTNSEEFQESESPLEAALGLDLTGTPVTIDLRKMPHGLIAGATGSGKSVCINSILVSLLYKADPHELKLMLIDPKMVELAPFNHIPHLVSPVITDVKAATAALKWAVEEMERRYQLFMHAGVRDLTRFNQQAEKNGQHGHKLPYILIVIDELADLMMMSPADVEEAICRIAQKARACGIHLIVATQRPSVDVITGLIKSNIPTRIAFAVSSAVDSRTILDMQGAERLLGRGDMLYLGNGMPAPVRLQGTFVTDDEIEEIIAYVRTQGEPAYFFQHDELLKRAEIVDEQDELFEEVCRYVFEAGTASTSSIQRRYKIGYNRAARLIDMLEKHGFVSEQRGSKPREVFITESDIISLFE